MANAEPVEALVEVARRAVERAGAAAMRHFRTDLAIEKKPDRTPVTAADRESEAAILEAIGARFPDHAILAEESGLHPGAPGKRWIVDPLDGTRGFTRGGPFWGPLVAFESGGEILAGALALPALGTTYYAGRGLGAFRDGERLRVSQVDTLEEATVSLGELKARALRVVPGEKLCYVTDLVYSEDNARRVAALALDADRREQLLVPVRRRQIEQTARGGHADARLRNAEQVVGEGDEPPGAAEDLRLGLREPGELRGPEGRVEECARARVHLRWIEALGQPLCGVCAARVAPAEDRRERVPVFVDGDEAVREARCRVRLRVAEDAPDGGGDLVGLCALVPLPAQLFRRLPALVEALRAHRRGADVEGEDCHRPSLAYPIP